MLTSPALQASQSGNPLNTATRFSASQGTPGQASFVGRTVTHLDRTSCTPEQDRQLVQLVNTAYGNERITSEKKSDPTPLYFCLVENGNFLSCAGYFRGDRTFVKGPALSETDCYITPFAALKGQGYGTALIKGMEQEAKQHGFTKLVFDVWNEAPVDMNPYYQKNGFEQGDTTPYVSQGKTHSMTRYTKNL